VIDGECDEGEKDDNCNKSISNQNHGLVYFLEGVIVKLGPASAIPNLLVPGSDLPQRSRTCSCLARICVSTRQDGM